MVPSEGTTITRTATLPAPREWVLVTVGDLDSDGTADFLWRHSSTGHWSRDVAHAREYRTCRGSWSMFRIFSGNLLRWTMDDDGQKDLVWQHAADGPGGGGAMQGLLRTGSSALPTPAMPQGLCGRGRNVDSDGRPGHLACGMPARAGWRPGVSTTTTRREAVCPPRDGREQLTEDMPWRNDGAHHQATN